MRKSSNLVKEYVFIILGSFILALGVNCFLVPLKLSTGGLSGIGTVLYYLFSIPLSATTLALNILLFPIGYKTLGKDSVVKTVTAVLVFPLFLELTEYFGSFTNDIFIASVFGGGLAGLGVGISILKGASTGGTDFSAVMLNKLFPHISITSFILIIDILIVLFSGIVFGNYTSMLYSALALYIGIRVADAVLVRGNYAKSVLIISSKNAEISKNIISVLERGVTGIYSKGLYNNTDGMMLMCVVKSKEIPKLLGIVEKTDESAFTVVSDVREVRGKGFKTMHNS